MAPNVRGPRRIDRDRAADVPKHVRLRRLTMSHYPHEHAPRLPAPDAGAPDRLRGPARRLPGAVPGGGAGGQPHHADRGLDAAGQRAGARRAARARERPGEPGRSPKLGVKLAIAAIVLLLVAKNRKFQSIPKGLWGLITGLTLVNAGVAVFWGDAAAAVAVVGQRRSADRRRLRVRSAHEAVRASRLRAASRRRAGGRGRPAYGRAALGGAEDPEQVPGEHPRRAPSRRSAAQPARPGRRLPAGPTGRRRSASPT